MEVSLDILKEVYYRLMKVGLPPRDLLTPEGQEKVNRLVTHAILTGRCLCARMDETGQLVLTLLKAKA